MLFETWSGLGRTALVGSLAYLALVVLVRVSGKRSLAQMNAFDWIVTVALGSTLATILLDKQTPLADGVTALALLIGLQFCLTWLTARSSLARRLVKAEPRMLFHRGKFLEKAMLEERVSRDELLEAMRKSGRGSLGSIEAVVLETNGRFSVLPRSEQSAADLLENTRRDPD
jgi:uncharacterized membrane protein YcaP (DUF421 family)